MRVGDLNLRETNDDARPQTIKIQEKIRHEDYKPPSQYNDIALLRLEKEVVFNAWVRPACLPVDWPDVGSNDKAVATGWGLVDWGENKNLHLNLHVIIIIQILTINTYIIFSERKKFFLMNIYLKKKKRV